MHRRTDGAADQMALPGFEAMAGQAAGPRTLPRSRRTALEAEGAILGFRGEFRWLSNFWFARVRLDGLAFPTVEHAYQAAKAADDGDDDDGWRRRFAKLARPEEAKRLGRAVPVRPGWDEMKERVMRELVGQKFALNRDLGERLRATGARPIVELNNWGDRFWGMVASPDDSLEGHNRLGCILMDVRALL